VLSRQRQEAVRESPDAVPLLRNKAAGRSISRTQAPTGPGPSSSGKSGSTTVQPSGLVLHFSWGGGEVRIYTLQARAWFRHPLNPAMKSFIHNGKGLQKLGPSEGFASKEFTLYGHLGPGHLLPVVRTVFNRRGIISSDRDPLLPAHWTPASLIQSYWLAWSAFCDAEATPVCKPFPNNTRHSHQNMVYDKFPRTQKHRCVWTRLATILASKTGGTSLKG